MEKLVVLICVIVGIGVSLFLFPYGFLASLFCAVCSLIAFAILRRSKEENQFLLQIFLGALVVRILIATMVHVFDLYNFFGGDSLTYDWRGLRLSEIWFGQAPIYDEYSQKVLSTSDAGWGMNYMVAFVYSIVGRNMLAVQYFSCVVGAATAPAIYICAHKIFNNIRVARTTAFIVAFCPSLVIWSSQVLKDGFIIFLLVIIMVALLNLLEEFSYVSLLILIFSLFGIISLRFYIFYMVAVAVMGAFMVGVGSFNAQSVFRRLAAVCIIGVGLTYLGILNRASAEIESISDLERIQNTRKANATAQSDRGNEKGSGYGEDLDISTPEGAISAIPIGFTYLMLAPFPWQIRNFRQAITLPEMLLWWASIPLLISGLYYTIRYHLRGSIGILFFTFMLTIAYSIFQGNVGMAYRQRAQIQVFLFIFIAVGWTIMQEKRENRNYLRNIEHQRLRERMQRRD
jgi:hypothetical protein